ncbi:pentatricopeptide repeat-containing protein [Tripterygium wilfordii]|uniref:Pentatricopeptide repeat-containing protein n=1 Tax=Tripterygium wilfordii TaxID=458696 RepID=A0A7J7DA64_TRIWF|nr:pentatricopeptide repeat-containing protein [Tripterygium wilfordii]
MSLYKKGTQAIDMKISASNKATTLNANAAEFVPFSLRSPTAPPGSTSTTDGTARFAATGSIGKSVLHRSESSVSNNSDEEAHQYWHCQLPDDITPDFKVMSEDESQGLGGLSLAGLSLHDGSEASRFPASTGSGYVLNGQPELYPRVSGNIFTEKMNYSAASYVEDDPSSASFLQLPGKPWDKKIVNNDQLLGNGRDGHPYNGNSRHSFMNEMFTEHGMVDNTDMNPLEFLAAQFPGFAAESLAEVYFANGCNFNSTVEMLTQLELQVDVGFSQNINSKALSAPNLSAGDDLLQNSNPYRSSDKENMLSFRSCSSVQSRDSVDFASAVRKLASQDSIWKYEGNGAVNSTVGSSRSSNVSASACSSGQGRSIYADRLRIRGSARVPPVWLETGDRVANLYSEVREEARDHARLRNVYFEQARQAYLIGNKALAKELSAKGQLHNAYMKEAHGKAQESIYRQRNPVGPEMQGNGRGDEQIIDLHGLHVNEAIHVLKHELSVLRSTARAADKRLQAYICVGTGHHTRGSRTPARLPIAVQGYLLEEECLDFSEPQPGLLRVVIY